MSGVNIEYKGESIATIPDTGSKAIKTQGKYCEGDILVEYEAPSTPTPTLITKQITENGTYAAAQDGVDGYSEVKVNVEAPTPLEEKDVNFYDYDGTVLYAFTKDEFLGTSEMPPLPEREGLVCQEWNWDYQEARDYVTVYGFLDIGAIYAADNGATRIYLKIDYPEQIPKQLSFYIWRCVVTVKINGQYIDEVTGDGTHTINLTFPSPAEYPALYTVELFSQPTQTNGQYYLTNSWFGSQLFNSGIYKIIVGVDFSKTVNYFNVPSSFDMDYILFPQGFKTLGVNSVSNTSVKFIVFPKSFYQIWHSAFENCYYLKKIIFNNGLTTFGNNSFLTCAKLRKIVIPEWDSIPNWFTYNKSLKKIVIPRSVQTIANSAFSYCFSLLEIDLSHFQDPSNLPSLTNANAFANTPTNQAIYVANQEMLDAFSTATNWSTYADRFQIKGATA